MRCAIEAEGEQQSGVGKEKVAVERQRSRTILEPGE
jgi:hypothetical protein